MDILTILKIIAAGGTLVTGLLVLIKPKAAEGFHRPDSQRTAGYLGIPLDLWRVVHRARSLSPGFTIPDSLPDAGLGLPGDRGGKARLHFH